MEKIREFIISQFDTARAEGMIHSKDGKHSKSSKADAETVISALSETKEEEMIERLADLEHEHWMTWAKSILPELHKLTESHNCQCDCPTCKRIIRWQNDCFMPYSQLSEERKEQDREQVRILLSKIALIFQAKLAEKDKEIEQLKDQLSDVERYAKEREADGRELFRELEYLKTENRDLRRR